MQTNDRQITDLMKSIDNGTTQLPDFQRGWVWDDNRIRALIASITNSFPVKLPIQPNRAPAPCCNQHCYPLVDRTVCKRRMGF